MPSPSISLRVQRSARLRLGATRTGGPACFTRTVHIHKELLARRLVTAELLAQKLEISARTIKRDIERLRDFHCAPLAWDAARKTYYYTEPFELADGLRLSAAETLAIVLAGQTFAAWAETPLGQTLTTAFTKIAQFTGHAVSLPAEEMRACLYHPETTASQDLEHRHFVPLLGDIHAGREIVLAYRKPKAARAEPRTVQPLHLARLDHRWMLVAHDKARDAWRNFLLARIETIAATGHRFKPPAREKILSYLDGSMGRFTGEKEITVRIAFDATVAPYVRERPWHTSQTLVEHPDGRIEASLCLNNVIDVQRRILACGSHAEVLAPPELRAAIQAEHATAAARYAGQ